MKQAISINVNGVDHHDEVEPRLLLVHYLRDLLGLTGTHIGCETSICGACTVLLDGQAEVLHDVRRAGQRREHHNYRRTGREWATASGARGLLGTSRFAMWLLHAGDDYSCDPNHRSQS